MIHVSSFLSFHHCVSFFESTRSSTILTSIVLSCLFISFVMCDPSKKRRKSLKQLEALSEPRMLVGNAPHLIFPPNEIFSKLENVNQTWEDVGKLFGSSGKSKLFVKSYDDAMQLLSNKTTPLKSDESQPLNPVKSGTSPDVMHPLCRKLRRSDFDCLAVEQSMELFCRHARKLRDSLMGLADNGHVFNVMEYTDLCAYKITFETAVGHEVFQDIWDFEFKQQVKAWRMLQYHLLNRSFKPWLKSDAIFYRTLAGKKVLQCCQKINIFSENATFIRRQRWEFLKANRFFDEKNLVQVEPECFLDLLLDLEDKDELVKNQVSHDLSNFLVAGYNTTRATLAWVLNLLAAHADIQEKCFQELIQVFQEEPRPGSSTSATYNSSTSPPESLATTASLIFATSFLPITTCHLDRLRYMESCILEALRLYPVLPWLLRRTDHDIELNDGRVIPAGREVSINSYVINRDPTRFPDPEQFKPERHEENEKVPPEPLLAFGAGLNNCPGMHFAIQQLKVVLAHLLLTFKWESNEESGKESVQGDAEQACFFHGVLLPAKGINVKISKR